MNIFSWSAICETGLQDVDDQHRHLFTITNDFGRLLAAETLRQADLESVLAELLKYTEYHFQEEEALMARCGLDQRHVDYHKQQHAAFLEEVQLLHHRMDFTQEETGQALFDFLINWLVYHILGSDMKMARQVELINASGQPSRAYAAAEQPGDKSTALLLEALTNLFQQVSQRNKALVALNDSLEEKVAARTSELTEANKKLEAIAITDVLTGLPNRRFALQWLTQLWQETAEQGRQLACILIDADGFKQVNDTHGHAAGDMVLQKLARHLTHAVRTDDRVCRLGGDEFLIICPKTSREGARKVATHVHAAIAKLSVSFPDGHWPGSISVGVAVKTAAMDHPEDLIKAADLGVYAAKDAGRNCVRMID